MPLEAFRRGQSAHKAATRVGWMHFLRPGASANTAMAFQLLLAGAGPCCCPPSANSNFSFWPRISKVPLGTKGSASTIRDLDSDSCSDSGDSLTDGQPLPPNPMITPVSCTDGVLSDNPDSCTIHLCSTAGAEAFPTRCNGTELLTEARVRKAKDRRIHDGRIAMLNGCHFSLLLRCICWNALFCFRVHVVVAFALQLLNPSFAK